MNLRLNNHKVGEQIDDDLLTQHLDQLHYESRSQPPEYHILN